MAARDGLAQLGHANALFARGVALRRRRTRRGRRFRDTRRLGGLRGRALGDRFEHVALQHLAALAGARYLLDREICLGEQLGRGRRRRRLALLHLTLASNGGGLLACLLDGIGPGAARGLSDSLRLGLSLWFSLGGRLGRRSTRRNLAEQGAESHRVALASGDFRQGAGGRRRYLDRHLVRLQFEQRLVGSDGVADLLEPLANGRLGDGFAERGYADFGSHCSACLSVFACCRLLVIRRARRREEPRAAPDVSTSGRSLEKPRPDGRCSARADAWRRYGRAPIPDRGR
jgi:hypothetical protein